MIVWYDECEDKGIGRNRVCLRLCRWGDSCEGATVITWQLADDLGLVIGKTTQEIIQPDVPKPQAIRMAIARFDELVKQHDGN